MFDRDEEAALEKAGRVLAETMLETVRREARRKIIENLYRQYSYSVAQWDRVTPDYRQELGKLEFIRDEMKRLLDNEANWR